MRKERINYIKSEKEGWISAYPVNMKGVCLQAKTLEELNERAKLMCKAWVEHFSDILEQDEPFELKEVTDFGEWLYGERDNKLREELQKYKDTFGEL